MTVISKDGFCPGCMMTKRVMNSLGIKYTVKHLKNNIALKNHIKDLGIEEYPIVEPNDKLDSSEWWGFRPSKIKAYAKSLK